jgi:glycine oxidase
MRRPYTPYNPLVNITVVGAGVVGCAVAYELASRGARVRLVDARGAGRGATGASAGILAPYIESHAASFQQLAVCSLASWDDFIQRVRTDSGHAVDYERSGTLQVALDSVQASALADASRLLQAAGVTHTLLDTREAARLEPGLCDRVTSALLLGEHGYVAPSQLIAALVQAATNRGAHLTNARVLRVEDGSHHATVTTEDGGMESDAVVLAAGAWPIEGAGPPTSPAVRPIRGQLVHLSADERPASRVVWGAECYIVPWRDGSVLVGATVEDVGFDERTTTDGVRGLLNAAVDLMPALRRARFHEARAGLRPKTADELPAIGRSSTMPHVFHAAGHYRNGVLLAPLTAALIADLVLDGRERPELALVRPDRFGL